MTQPQGVASCVSCLLGYHPGNLSSGSLVISADDIRRATTSRYGQGRSARPRALRRLPLIRLDHFARRQS